MLLNAKDNCGYYNLYVTYSESRQLLPAALELRRVVMLSLYEDRGVGHGEEVH